MAITYISKAKKLALVSKSVYLDSCCRQVAFWQIDQFFGFKQTEMYVSEEEITQISSSRLCDLCYTTAHKS